MALENLCGIYKITNIINNKCYIGKSNNIGNRWSKHLKSLYANSHHSYKLQNDFNEFGINNFTFQVLELTDSDIKNMDFLRLEDSYIDKFDSLNDGYNCEDTVEKVNNIIQDKIKNYKKSSNTNDKNNIPKNIALNINKKRLDYILDKCNSHIFKENFERISSIFQSIGFRNKFLFQLLRDLNILDINNKCLIDDSNMFKCEKKNTVDSKTKEQIEYYVTSINKYGFEFLINKILDAVNQQNIINIFSKKFLQELNHIY